MDSGAFTTVTTHGYYPASVAKYAGEIHRWKTCGNMLRAVAQDYMCERFVLQKTGLTVREHQRLTLQRYRELIDLVPENLIMPVLQGFEPGEYVQHLRDYGELFSPGHWVGVGSVCKRQGEPAEIYQVLKAIKDERPDLRLHGFGVKVTALDYPAIREMLYSADSMAWSYSARKQGRDAHDWREARAFENRINSGRKRLSL
ncbi:MAG: hypothetical protein EBX40_06620, partial [Gammaproteobacteria bacterium]|nr:hypothetical protein [Gammaproteobacteria bacterium]